MQTRIEQLTNEPVIDIALDTIRIGKQALIFVNTKPSAERCAEEISKKIRVKNKELDGLSEEVLHAISKPTAQCERLSRVIKKGIAFHHAGLVDKQKSLIEDEFRKGRIKIICCTPTLAAGVNLPAYRTVIRDLKRYGHHGLAWIPVLEYHQQAGRAGRPGYDEHGVAITLAGSESEKGAIMERYLNGEPEEIFSKLAVEPVLRTYLLALIAADFVNSEKAIIEFFSKTFWAYQFQDMSKLVVIIKKMLALLEGWEFIRIPQKEDFVSAAELNDENNTRIVSTLLGKKVAELYIDPLTAHHFVVCLGKRREGLMPFSFLQMISYTLEMRPLLSVKTREWEELQERMAKHSEELLVSEPSLYDEEYDEFLNSAKTGFMLLDWTEEKEEVFILEHYGVRPGELRVKQEIGDWLIYSCEEICRILSFGEARRELMKLRVRLKHGAREELLALLKLKNIGRIRARKLYNNKIRDISELKKADLSLLVHLIGEKTALDVKKQVGEEVDEGKIRVKENRKKGQLSLNDYKG